MAKNEVKINITGDNAKLGSALNEASGKLDKFSSHMTSVFKGIGKAALVGGAAIATGLVGGVVGLAKLGESFDDAYDKIRIGTGATGKALDGLESSFKSVVSTVPVSFGDASTAIEKLNQGLKLTGKPLEVMATQVLNLSRITKTDLSANVQAVTGLMNSWGVSADKQGAKLDELFRVSQATGISVADLAAQMTGSGVQFRAAGLSYESTAALLGLLAKNGLDAGDVIPALSKAMATAAKEGKPAAQVFQATFDAIRSAPNDTKAAGIAMDVFGAKAGPKFAALIRTGQLSYAEFAKTIAAGGDTINAAAKDTDDWKEKLKLLTNKVLVALEPIASRVFGGLTKLVDMASHAVKEFTAGWIASSGGEASSSQSKWAVFGQTIYDKFYAVQQFFIAHWPDIKRVVLDVFNAIKDAIGYVVDNILPKVKEGIETAFQFMMKHKEVLVGALVAIGIAFVAWGISASEAALATIAATAPVLAIAAAIGALVAGIIYAYKHWGWFKDAVDAAGRWLRDVFWPAAKEVFGWLRDNVPPILEAIGRFLRDKVLPALEAFGRFLRDDVWPVMQTVFGWLRDNVPPIVEGIGRAFRDDIIPAVQAVIGWLRDDFWPVVQNVFGWLRDNVLPIVEAVGRFLVDKILPPAMQVAQFIGETFWTVAKAVFGWLRDYVPPIIEVIGNIFTNILIPAAKKVASFFTDVLWPAAQAVFNWLDTNIPRILGAAKTVFETVIMPPLRVLQTIFETLWTAAKDVFNWLDTNIPRIINALAPVFDNVIMPPLRLLKTIFEDLWSAAKSVFNWLDDKVGPIISKIGDLVGDVVRFSIGPAVAAVQGIVNAITAVYDKAVALYYKGKSLLTGMDQSSGGTYDAKAAEATASASGLGAVKAKVSAVGAVAYGPQLLLTGEYSGAGHNPEITAPQTMIAQTVNDVLNSRRWTSADSAAASSQSLTVLVDARGATDPYAVGEATVKAIQNYERAAGTGWRTGQGNR